MNRTLKIMSCLLLVGLLLLAGLAVSARAEDNNPLSCTIQLDKTSVDTAKGETITVSWSIWGGMPPYTVDRLYLDGGKWITFRVLAGNRAVFTPWFYHVGSSRHIVLR